MKKGLGNNHVLNKMTFEFGAKSANVSFARSVVALFASQLNPTVEEIDDLKTAVSEAVTNCIVHAYQDKGGAISIEAELYPNSIRVIVIDKGVGIDNVGQALEPFFTTRPTDEDRSGMGFTVMQSFMDTLDVTSKASDGTTVIMQKFFTPLKEAKRAVGGA